MAKLWLALVKVNEGARSQVVPLLSATVSSRLVAGLAFLGFITGRNNKNGG
jgi:hypothetical protein